MEKMIICFALTKKTAWAPLVTPLGRAIRHYHREADACLAHVGLLTWLFAQLRAKSHVSVKRFISHTVNKDVAIVGSILNTCTPKTGRITRVHMLTMHELL